MKRALLFGLCVVGLTSCVQNSPHKAQELESTRRAQALSQDKAHSASCQTILDDFRKNARLGMTSKQLAGAVRTEWAKKAHVSAITALGGLIPLAMDDSSTCYCALLYPNEDNWSNYVIYFRISKPRNAHLQEADKIGKDFLQGDLQEASVVLKEFALCSPGKTLQESGPIERFPNQKVQKE